MEKEGKKFIAASLLAEEFGYDQNHIGLLARQGKIEAVKTGKRWFVTRESLSTYKFKIAQERKANALKSIKVPRKPIAPSTVSQITDGNRAIRSYLSSGILKLGLGYALVALFVSFALVQFSDGQVLGFRPYGAFLLSQSPGKTLAQISEEENLKDLLNNYGNATEKLKEFILEEERIITEITGKIETTQRIKESPEPLVTETRIIETRVIVPSEINLNISRIEQFIQESQGRFASIDERFRNVPTILQTAPTYSGGGNSTVTIVNPDTVDSSTVKVSSLLDVSGSAEIDGALTLGGNFTADTNTFFIDSSNNRVGVLTTSPETAFEVVGLASASQFSGAGLTDCDADNQTLNWDSTTKLFSCGDDDSGGEGSAPKTEEGGAQKVANSSIFNFDIGGFALIASGTTETIIAIDYDNGPASRTAAQTVTGFWTFSGGVSVSTNFELTASASMPAARPTPLWKSAARLPSPATSPPWAPLSQPMPVLLPFQAAWP
ncbi:MAG: helix-turn-helix domain-containing protein [Parcubacteria group bacterium]|nr:helix-turn-helix domain-containing protein [Parcubacteria group bacterium]